MRRNGIGRDHSGPLVADQIEISFSSLLLTHALDTQTAFAFLQPLPNFEMAAVAARASCSVVACPVAVTSPRAARSSSIKAGARKLSLFGGLKAENKVMALGLIPSTEQKFASLATSCSARSRTRCDVGSEILTIIPIMSALTLAGIAIGFVLLRVEAAVEESE
ncbi:hypothetical protein R1sor_003764 [Riccia sorocarpa]|uniref:Uncharacterized protein n=1 Tax=Riccia sorocarpa TaxID=122646 RepID=A0ABD3H2K3_9MARC